MEPLTGPENVGRGVAPEDEEAYVLKLAVLRRHLTDDQRAMLAAKWKAGNKAQGRRTDLTSPQRCGEVDTPQAASDLFRISRRGIDEATQVLRAAPALAEAVACGDKPLKAAIREVKQQARATEDDRTPSVWPVKLTACGPAGVLGRLFEPRADP